MWELPSDGIGDPGVVALGCAYVLPVSPDGGVGLIVTFLRWWETLIRLDAEKKMQVYSQDFGSTFLVPSLRT